MDAFSTDHLRSLIETPRGRCISIFLPTHRLGPERQQDPVRLKNLLRETEDRLSAQGQRDRQAQEMLAPAWQLVEDMTFWQHQSDGLAIFMAPDVFQTYRVPVDFQEQTFISDRFHLKPLLPLLTGDGRFFILAISQGDVRLFRGTRDGASEVELEGVPRSLAEALQYDEYGENQYYTNTTSSIAAGRGVAHYAGSGMSLDDDSDNIIRYAQKVDHGLQRYLRNEQAPLVLAAPEQLQAAYRKANTYQHMVDRIISINPDSIRVEDLHQRAWDIVNPIFNQEQQEAADRYRRYQGANQELVSHDPRQILPAAYYGQIDSLFITMGNQIWGSFDPQNNRLEVHDSPQDGDDDLIDLAAVHTILNSGKVYCFNADELGDDRPIAAVLRYSV